MEEYQAAQSMGGMANYDVPFLARPFGTMYGSTGGLFGPAGFSDMRASLLLRVHASASAGTECSNRQLLVEELVDDAEEGLEQAACQHQHIIEHPDDILELTHDTPKQATHEACQGTADGNMLDVTGSRYQTLDIHRPRSHLPGFNSIDCSPSAPKIEFCEGNMKIRKWDTMICDDSTVSSVPKEPPRKQLRT